MNRNKEKTGKTLIKVNWGGVILLAFLSCSSADGLLTNKILQFYIDWFYECINNGEAIIY